MTLAGPARSGVQRRMFFEVLKETQVRRLRCRPALSTTGNRVLGLPSDLGEHAGNPPSSSLWAAARTAPGFEAVITPPLP